jgi:hypothetical protein
MGFVGLAMASFSYGQQAVLFDVQKGQIDFHSKAPKELIHASSSSLKGVVDVQKKVFAFKIPISSFLGFNSPLQREHFNENYMESGQFPDASFSGKILDPFDFSQDGTYRLRAKGRLSIHGLDQERIVPVAVTIKGNTIDVASDFEVPLADHNIKIPRIVYDKLAPLIAVSVKASLTPHR